jgi:hypothetical protein
MGEKMIRTLRTQAWERAKGELNAMMHTYWSEEEQASDMQDALDEFVQKVEDNALQE